MREVVVCFGKNSHVQKPFLSMVKSYNFSLYLTGFSIKNDDHSARKFDTMGQNEEKYSKYSRMYGIFLFFF